MRKTKEEIHAAAIAYAEEQCSCYANDLDGFEAGAEWMQEAAAAPILLNERKPANLQRVLVYIDKWHVAYWEDDRDIYVEGLTSDIPRSRIRGWLPLPQSFGAVTYDTPPGKYLVQGDPGTIEELARYHPIPRSEFKRIGRNERLHAGCKSNAIILESDFRLYRARFCPGCGRPIGL